MDKYFYTDKTGVKFQEETTLNILLFLFFGRNPKNRLYFKEMNHVSVQSYPARIRWALFGEWRFIGWYIGIFIIFFIGLIYVILHFVIKYW